MLDDREDHEDYENEEEDPEIIEEEYKIWKKNSPLLYDLVITSALKSPSLTVEWFSEIEKTQRLLIGTNTMSEEQNQLIVLKVKLPNQEAAIGKDAKALDNSDYNKVSNKIEIEKAVNHEGEINKARIMPKNSNIIATKTVSGEIHIFDLNKNQGSNKNKIVNTEMRLTGHDSEGFGLCWSPLKEGYLVSGANDNRVCLYDIKSNKTSPIRVLNFHSNFVGDVMFSNLDENIFGSVGDDKKLIIYDLREEKPIFNISAHTQEINSLDFNYFNKNLIITSSNDKLIALWDMRDLSKKLHTFDQHTREVLTSRWSPKIESLFFSTSNDRRINIWDVSKIGVEQSVTDAEDGPAELLFTHGGHTDKISDVAWNQDEELMLASVAEDSVVHVWEMANYIYYGEDDECDEEDEKVRIDHN